MELFKEFPYLVNLLFTARCRAEWKSTPITLRVPNCAKFHPSVITHRDKYAMTSALVIVNIIPLLLFFAYVYIFCVCAYMFVYSLIIAISSYVRLVVRRVRFLIVIANTNASVLVTILCSNFSYLAINVKRSNEMRREGEEEKEGRRREGEREEKARKRRSRCREEKDEEKGYSPLVIFHTTPSTFKVSIPFFFLNNFFLRCLTYTSSSSFCFLVHSERKSASECVEGSTARGTSKRTRRIATVFLSTLSDSCETILLRKT